MSYRLHRVDGTDASTASIINEMHERCFGNSAPSIDPSKGRYWLVKHNREPVAFAGLEPSSYSKTLGYLNRSGVLRKHRGNGLQYRLVQARLKHAKALGWACVRSDTTANLPSANTLIRAGFRLFNPRTPWGPELDTLYWRKSLV